MLSEDEISLRLQRAYRPGVIASTDGYAGVNDGFPLTCAAVLLPLARREDGWHILLTRRTDSVEHHKGQVSFPGGACDPQDSGPEATALREAEEEIGLHPTDVRLLGRLNDIVTITRYRVTPVVGVIPWPYSFRPAPGEVARIFTIPLVWLAQRQNYSEQPFTPLGQPRPVPVVIYREYDGEILWGASARIVLNFLDALEL
ncbi:MAG: CoA pyrophosphatase [Anaerolineales bacterium]|nr:CoA pyrophosphatase [Anaerolineales bacterium]